MKTDTWMLGIAPGHTTPHQANESCDLFCLEIPEYDPGWTYHLPGAFKLVTDDYELQKRTVSKKEVWYRSRLKKQGDAE